MKPYLELGPEATKWCLHRSRFSDEWLTAGLISVSKDTTVDVECNLEEPWPLPSSAFRIVHASHVLEHVVDWSSFLSEAHRVLAPGGVFHLSVPDAADTMRRYLAGRGQIDDVVRDIINPVPGLLNHQAAYDGRKLLRCLLVHFPYATITEPGWSVEPLLRHKYFNNRPEKSIFAEAYKA